MCHQLLVSDNYTYPQVLGYCASSAAHHGKNLSFVTNIAAIDWFYLIYSEDGNPILLPPASCPVGVVNCNSLALPKLIVPSMYYQLGDFGSECNTSDSEGIGMSEIWGYILRMLTAYVDCRCSFSSN
jgi:hypothetical protein